MLWVNMQQNLSKLYQRAPLFHISSLHAPLRSWSPTFLCASWNLIMEKIWIAFKVKNKYFLDSIWINSLYKLWWFTSQRVKWYSQLHLLSNQQESSCYLGIYLCSSFFENEVLGIKRNKNLPGYAEATETTSSIKIERESKLTPLQDFQLCRLSIYIFPVWYFNLELNWFIKLSSKLPNITYATYFLS